MAAAKASPTPFRLPPLPTIRDLVKLYRLRAIKQLSQNFLMDERLTDKIVKSAGKIQNHYVCEVGPGPGGITRSILKKQPRKLIVVEKDPRFLPTLELLKESCVETTDMVIEIDDIRNYNFEFGFKGASKMNWFEAPPPVHLIGNLPFSVSTNLIIRWLKSVSEKNSAWSFGRSSMTLTFQKEVAERMTAPVGHEQRCRLSVMCQSWCDVQHKFTIPVKNVQNPEVRFYKLIISDREQQNFHRLDIDPNIKLGTAFVPKPQVDVGVVTLVPLKRPIVEDLPFEMVEKVLRTIFNMRQKFSIKSACRLFPEDLRETLGSKLYYLADLHKDIRPFQISNEEFARLCFAYRVICEENPGVLEYDFRARKVAS